MKKIKIIGLTLVISITILTLAFLFPIGKLAPLGAPSNYYEIVSEINNTNSNILIYGEPNLVSDELEFNIIDNFSSLANARSESIVIIDFSSIDIISDDDVRIIEDAYLNRCFMVVLLNYGTSMSGSLNEIIDDEDTNEDFLILDQTSCGGLYFSKVLISEETNKSSSQYQLMYSILKNLE